MLREAGLPPGGMQLIDDARRDVLARLMQPLNPSKSAGGSAGNTIKALAALGADCLFVGKVGADEDAALLAESYRRQGAQVRLLSSPLHTGVASTFISPTGERTFGTCLGAASTLSAGEVDERLLDGVTRTATCRLAGIQGLHQPGQCFTPGVINQLHATRRQSCLAKQIIVLQMHQHID